MDTVGTLELEVIFLLLRVYIILTNPSSKDRRELDEVPYFTITDVSNNPTLLVLVLESSKRSYHALGSTETTFQFSLMSCQILPLLRQGWRQHPGGWQLGHGH